MKPAPRRRAKPPVTITPAQVRAAWLRAQRLDEEAPFGAGPEAAHAATAHLGYVQIDTINVIERSHHHILHTRIPTYTRADLDQAQSADKSVFEYWTHALSYVAAEDFRYFIPAMQRYRATPGPDFADVNPADYVAMLKRIRRDGPLTIRDIDDDVLVEKTHPWASRKPSKRVLKLGFYAGDLVISRRHGMVKTYELTKRHFGWRSGPKPAAETQIAEYMLRRALTSQGVVSLDSVCYGSLSSKPQVAAVIEALVRRKRLVPVQVEGFEKIPHWAEPATLDTTIEVAPRTHILSPFDPLVIQRKRLEMFFGHIHRFEAYVPAPKRILGYFALPVVIGDEVVAAIDIKTDRQARKLLIQKWTWIVQEREGLKAAIDETLTRFRRFQLAGTPED